MITRLRIHVVTLAVLVLLPGCLLSAQQASQPAAADQSQPVSDQEIDLMRKDIQSQKRQVIAANMKLTDKEAEQFWPIFDQYNSELIKINDKKYAAIKEFARSYDNLTGDQAEKLTREGLEVDQAVAQLRQKYIPIFSKVVPGKKTALFMQLDRRLVMMIDLQLSAAIPLVEP
jgi:Spy/CpxP family protein refolding chaperone